MHRSHEISRGARKLAGATYPRQSLTYIMVHMISRVLRIPLELVD
jgi:hypothetical protein